MFYNIKLSKGMRSVDVNNLIGEWLTLEDEMFLGVGYKHNWKCKCGTIINNKKWSCIKKSDSIQCNSCKLNKTERRYQYEVGNIDGYVYIRSYRSGDILPSGKKVGDSPYIQVLHKYCNNIYEILANNFINTGQRCGKCCGSYENSFAHHIEVELGEPLDKYWDFEKNTVNPYHISKGFHKKVWIKCQEKYYHGSYEVSCDSFSIGRRCSFCGCHKTHPKDSFAQYHIDNTDPDFLEKYWDWDKNTVSPWEISPSGNKKVWIKCQNEEVNELNGLKKKDYHGSYETKCSDFTSGNRCSFCNNRGKSKIHPYDSFGYHHFDKAMSWSPDNDISPFRVAKSSGKKYKFICYECGNLFYKKICHIHSYDIWCPQCSMSKGEKAISKWLRYNDIDYEYEKEYDGLIGIGGKNLSYDFYLPNYNILIEYQGEQHEKFIKGIHVTYDVFGRQLEHDRRKREYAENNGFKLIEIWYWDFDNIEKILDREIKQSN